MYHVWQAMVGRRQEFETALRKLRGPNANISQEEADIQVLANPTFFFWLFMPKIAHVINLVLLV